MCVEKQIVTADTATQFGVSEHFLPVDAAAVQQTCSNRLDFRSWQHLDVKDCEPVKLPILFFKV